MTLDLGARITRLADELESEKKAHGEVIESLNKFADLLFDELRHVTDQLADLTDRVSKAELKVSADGTRQLGFKLGQYELTFRMAEKAAGPDETEETLSIRHRYGSPCGALWMFVDMRKASQRPFYQIYVFGDSCWYGYGVGGPPCHDVRSPLDREKARTLAMDIIESTHSSIHSTWKSRHQIESDTLGVAREQIGFRTS